MKLRVVKPSQCTSTVYCTFRAFSRDVTAAVLVFSTNNLQLFDTPTWPPCSLFVVSLKIE